jgi:HSP20 family protein
LRSLMPLRDHGGLARPEATPFVFGSLQREIDRLFEEFTRGLPMLATPAMMSIVPKVDVAETDKEIEITVELPGLERKDVEISVEDDVLIIRGEKKMETEDGSKAQGSKAQGKDQGGKAQGEPRGNGGSNNKNYHLSERSYGVFVRMLQLPPGIDPSSIQATMSNGVLKITIPKPAKSQAKKIEVKEAA